MSDIQTPEGTEEIKPEIEIKPDEVQQQPQPKPEDTVDYWKEKFSNSSSEANLLREAETARKRAEQESSKEPTDSDLRTAFPLWDSYDEVQKDFAKRTFSAERTAGTAARIARELQADRSWNTSIELALTSNNALLGKEQAFRQFASQPKYKGADMGLLIDAFLHKNPSAPAPTVTPRPGLESGNGGPRTPEKPKTLSADELGALRTSNPKAYTEYIKTHDISVEV